MTSSLRELTETGYAVVPGVIGSEEVAHIGESISGTLGGNAGTRRLIETPWCRDLADRLTRDRRYAIRCLMIRGLSSALCSSSRPRRIGSCRSIRT